MDIKIDYNALSICGSTAVFCSIGKFFFRAMSPKIPNSHKKLDELEEIASLSFGTVAGYIAHKESPDKKFTSAGTSLEGRITPRAKQSISQ